MCQAIVPLEITTHLSPIMVWTNHQQLALEDVLPGQQSKIENPVC